jgi:hypothetical protein
MEVHIASILSFNVMLEGLINSLRKVARSCQQVCPRTPPRYCIKWYAKWPLRTRARMPWQWLCWLRGLPTRTWTARVASRTKRVGGEIGAAGLSNPCLVLIRGRQCLHEKCPYKRGKRGRKQLKLGRERLDHEPQVSKLTMSHHTPNTPDPRGPVAPVKLTEAELNTVAGGRSTMPLPKFARLDDPEPCPW